MIESCNSREPRTATSSLRSRSGPDASRPGARRRCDDAAREAVMSATIEREQAGVELAHFIRQQAGEQNSITALAEGIPQIVWTARPDGWIEFCNRRCLEYLGVALEQIRGWDWQSVIHPADVPVSLERWRHALASGNVFEVEYRI